MGNAPSTPSDKPAPPLPKESRRETRRRESVNALSPAISKPTAAPPSASLESAIAHTSSSFKQISQVPTPTQPKNVPIVGSHGRNRSQTIATPRLQPQDVPIVGSLPKRAVSASSSTGRTPPDGSRISDAQLISPLTPAASEPYNLPPPSYSRPPRLPLPIEEETLAPGSPITSQTAFAPEFSEADENFTRRVSVISSTVDDDDDPDGFLGHVETDGVPKVSTIIEYREAAPGERVYVTGTFTDWQRKFRLHANGPSKVRGALSATLQLQPGTHHIKFLVKDDMVCSSYLPTTVDYTNILVNYIEVLPDKPVVSAVPSGHATTVPSKPLDITTKGTETASPARSQALYHQASPSSARASPTPQQKDQAKASRVASPATAAASRQPPKFYTSQIPSYLLDLDTWPPPDDNDRGSPDPSSATARFHRANAATSNLPAPPSLPLFLSKSILNGTTPMKDDNSVLIMPNHTVLNHLATTNIRGGVLATSATCRYKKKFLTSILYMSRD